MTKRNYKRILRLLNKALDLLRKEQVYYHLESYANCKIKIKRVIEALEENRKWWKD